METVFFALSLWPLARLTKKILSQKWVIPISLVWIFSPWVLNPNIFEFHAIALFPFFVFWAMFFYLENKFFPFLLFLFSALLIREDVSFFVMSLSLLAFLEHRENKWKFLPLLLGAGYFFLSIFMIRSFSTFEHYPFLSLYGWLGNDWFQIIKTVFFHPWRVFAHIFSFRSLIFVSGILLPFGFVPILGWRYLLLHLITFFQLALMGNGPTAFIFHAHYVLLFAPGLFLAYLFGIQRILKEKRFYVYRGAMGVVAILAIFYGAFTLGPFYSFFEERNTELSKEKENKKELLAIIPRDAKILVSDNPLALVSARNDVFLLRYLMMGKTQYRLSDFSLPDAIDFALIDIRDLMKYDIQYREHPFYREDYTFGTARLRAFLQEGNFGLRQRAGTWLLFERSFKENGEYYLWREHNVFPKSLAVHIPERKNELISLVGVTEKITDNEVSLRLFWKKEKETHENFAVLVTVQNKNGGKPFTYYEFLGGGIFPTSDWKVKNIIETKHIIPFQQDIFSSGMYTIEVSLFRFHGAIDMDALGTPALIIDSKEYIGEPYKLPLFFY